MTKTREKLTRTIIDPDQFPLLITRHACDGTVYSETQLVTTESMNREVKKLRQTCGDDLIKVYKMVPIKVA